MSILAAVTVRSFHLSHSLVGHVLEFSFCVQIGEILEYCGNTKHNFKAVWNVLLVQSIRNGTCWRSASAPIARGPGESLPDNTFEETGLLGK